MSDRGTNLKALFDGMLATLEGSIKSPPWRVRYQSGQWPEQRSAELEGLRQQLSLRRSDGQIKVAEGYDERRKEMLRVVEERRLRLEAYAGRTRQLVAAQADKFIVAGRVTDQASGVGLPNVKVSAFDMDRRQDDYLGNARTDALGYFRIEYSAADFRDHGEEPQPETYIQVLGEDGQVLYTSTKSFVQKAGEAQFVKVEMDGETLTRNLDAGRRIDASVKLRLDGIETRKRLLSTGAVAFMPSRPVTSATPATPATPAILATSVVRRDAAAGKTQVKAKATTAKPATVAKAATSTTKRQATNKTTATMAKRQATTNKAATSTAKPTGAATARATPATSKTAGKAGTAAASKSTARKTTAKKTNTRKTTAAKATRSKKTSS